MFRHAMDDHACRALATDMSEPEAPPKVNPGPSIAELREQLAGAKNALWDEMKVADGRRRRIAELERNLHDLQMRVSAPREPLPSAAPDMREGESLKGIVLGGALHGKHVDRRGERFTAPVFTPGRAHFRGEESIEDAVATETYRRQPLHTDTRGGTIDVWVPEHLGLNDVAAFILRLAARPNAPESVKTITMRDLKPTYTLAGRKPDAVVIDDVVREDLAAQFDKAVWTRQYFLATEVLEAERRIEDGAKIAANVVAAERKRRRPSKLPPADMVKCPHCCTVHRADANHHCR